MTEWVNPMFAGGYSQGPVLVLINGSALTTNPGLPLKFNSPDINGDLRVDLTDRSTKIYSSTLCPNHLKKTWPL